VLKNRRILAIKRIPKIVLLHEKLMLSKLGMTSTRTRPFKAPQWLLSEATRVNGGALRVGFTYTNPVTSLFVYAVEIVFQSKHRSQAFGNIKNAKNNRWDPCQFTF
jgi:predicted deacetylase